MTPKELLALAEAATPGPWRTIEATAYEADFDAGTEADARLIALAPDLARLCAEMGEALANMLAVAEWTANYPAGTHAYPEIAGSVAKGEAALAKLAKLEART